LEADVKAGVCYRAYQPKGYDLMLDSFAGSGTIAIACEKHGRRARMMELDSVY
jgi:DNA modification methylase|tara:strand:- start:282 stop:440 length:159 start_codon:yes stop_codon:yes gene_type:complete